MINYLGKILPLIFFIVIFFQFLELGRLGLLLLNKFILIFINIVMVLVYFHNCIHHPLQAFRGSCGVGLIEDYVVIALIYYHFNEVRDFNDNLFTRLINLPIWYNVIEDRFRYIYYILD